MKKQKIIDDFTDEDKVQSEFNFWNYETEPELIGVVLRREIGLYGDVIIIETEKGEVSLPSLTALNSQLIKASVRDKIKIKYLGEEKSQKTGRLYKNFNVFIKSQ